MEEVNTDSSIRAGSSVPPSAPPTHTVGARGMSLGYRIRDQLQNLARTKYELLDSGQVT